MSVFVTLLLTFTAGAENAGLENVGLEIDWKVTNLG